MPKTTQPAPPPTQRLTSVRIRLNDQEKQELADQAWRSRKTVSQYVRDTLKLEKGSKG